MTEIDPARPPAQRFKNFPAAVAFCSGVVCASLMFSAAVLVSRLSPETTARIRNAVRPATPVLEVPLDVLEELRAQRAVIDNAGDHLTPQAEHDTILTLEDADLDFALRPLVHLTVDVLPAGGEMNLDPPVLYRLLSAPGSATAQQWIRGQSRIQVTNSIDRHGRRLTVPEVGSDRKILIVGDSVAFGVGVNDEDTIPSQLQEMLGASAQVINAGVGEYDGDQVFQMADRLSRGEKYAALVYIACQNDFEMIEDLPRQLARFKEIGDRFDGNIIVILETYLEYNARDVLLNRGWSASEIGRTHEIRDVFSREAGAMGFRQADWSEIVEQYRRSAGSVFAPFALYVDGCHLSRTGTRLMAERIRQLL